MAERKSRRGAARLAAASAWAAGLLLLAFVLGRAGLETAFRQALSMGPGAFLLLPLALAWIVPNTLAWRAALGPGRTGFGRLLAARLGGESVNSLLPSGYLGGEPVKAVLLSPSVPFDEAMGSVLLAKTTQTFALLLFIGAGLGAAAGLGALPGGLRVPAAAAAAVLTAGVAGMGLGAARGWLGASARRLAAARPDSAARARLADRLTAFDRRLAEAFRRGRAGLAASTAWHLAGWCLGALEVWAAARLMGLPLGLGESWLVASLAMTAAVAGFFLPGSLGAFEGGHVLGGAAVGLPAEAGLAIALARRAREAVWLLLGLALLYRLFPSWRAATGTS